MNQNARRTFPRVMGALLVAVPFVFGALRALQTGSDFRYLVTAFGSFAAAATILRFGASSRDAALPLLRLVLAVVGATLVAAAVAFGLGATSVLAILVVASAFSLCATTGLALWRLAPSPRP